VPATTRIATVVQSDRKRLAKGPSETAREAMYLYESFDDVEARLLIQSAESPNRSIEGDNLQGVMTGSLT
jgi:hypothetical protein